MLAPRFQVSPDFPPVDYAQWRQQVTSDLAGVPFEKKLVSRLYEEIDLQPIYSPESWSAERDANGMPGSAPFVRGTETLRQGWEIRAAYSHPDPPVTNKQIQQDLLRGVMGVQLILDRAGRAGRNADADQGVGEAGLMVSSMADLGQALAGVLPEAAPVSLDGGANFVISSALLAALWRSRGQAATARGSLGADPLGSLAREGKVAGSVDTALEKLGELAVWTDRNLPHMTTATVSTAAYHGAGASAVQDLALAMATGVAYLRAMTAAGLGIDAACRQITFDFSLGTHFFKEIARLRAARRLWARVCGACGASGEAGAMRFGASNASTAQRALTQRDPWVNILRATVGCFAAAVGGAESICVAPFDSRLGLPGEQGRRIARNTQVILQEESHLGRVIDPAGGCWFIEKLTDELAEAAWKLFQEIERQGGVAQALTQGWVAAQLDAVWSKRLKNLGRRKDAVTGVSEFPNIREQLPENPQPDLSALRERAVAGLEGKKTQGAGEFKLAGLRGADQIEALVASAEAGTTLGVLSAALAAPIVSVMAPLPFRPLAGVFEALRDAADDLLLRNDKRPQVFLANLGPVAHHTARASWSQNFFEAGGFETLSNTGFPDAAAAAEAWKGSGSAIAVICSSDKFYATQAAETASALKAAGARTVVLAGNPGENREAWSAAGVDHYIHIGCDVEGTLRMLLIQEGAQL